jgi:hypothetical protein
MDIKLTMIVSWWAQRLDKGDKAAFVKALRQEIEANPPHHLDVDYDPKDELLTAVRASGVECRGDAFSADGVLPRKTTMWITETKVEVREGRGAPIETIWDASWFE